MNYYNGVTTDNYKKYIGSGMASFILFNDDLGNDLMFSLDGKNTMGILHAGEGIDFRFADVESIYLKSFVPGAFAPFRLWFFGNKSLIYPDHNKKGFDNSQQANVPIAFIREEI